MRLHPQTVPIPLLSRAVTSVLQVIALNPERPFFQRELARLTGEPYTGVVQALARLTTEQLVRPTPLGGRRAFVMNPDNPYFEEFQRMAIKSLDLPRALDRAGVVAISVVVFGSFAKGDADPDSDLDVLVVGAEPSLGVAEEALVPIAARIGRVINVHVVDHARYQHEIGEPASFVAAVAAGPTINLRGSL